MNKNGFFLVLVLMLLSNALSAQKNMKTAGSSKDKSTSTPCMDVLDLFTAPGVPAMGPDETFAPVGNWTKGVTPPNLPGKGLAQHPMLVVGENYDKMSLMKDGKEIWSYSTGTSYEYDDVWMLSNGNILFTRQEYIAEITPDKKVIWRYDCKTAKGSPEHTEIHTCQPIGLDKVMFIVNGLPPKLMIVNIKTGKTEVEHELPYTLPANPDGIHGQYRRARITAQGTYLISVFGLGYVAEYDKNFNEIWRVNCKLPWSSLRLKNGNTLITNEADNLTVELNSKKDTVWQFSTKNDLPEAYRFASAPQTCTRLANGNTIFTSRGDNDGNGPQMVEVTPDKKVVWVLQDWKTFGPVTSVQVLDDPGIPEIPGQSEH